MAAPRALRGAVISRGSVDPAATIRRPRGVNDAPIASAIIAMSSPEISNGP